MSKVYPEAVIYKISTSDNSKVYYGSTNNFRNRKSVHLYKYRNYLNGGSVAYLTAFEVLSDPDCKFEIITTLQNISKQELEKLESHYILNNPCVNSNKILGDKVKSKQASKNRFYQKHKNKIKEYYKKNRDLLCEKERKYRKENNDKIRERRAERVACDCGKTVSRGFLAKHKRTKTHLDFESSKPINLTINGNINTLNINNK
jgi:hypothetical protein